MRNTSSAFNRALANDKRDYQNRLVVTLADNTVLHVSNPQIMENGLKIDDAVSADNVFQVGAAIINQGTFVLNNIYDEFSAYSFDGAKIVAYTGLAGLDDGSTEEIKLGTYNADETNYNGSLITLTCLDNMAKFDKAYSTTLSYPATLFDIVSDACNRCGVTLANSSLNFPHKDYIVTDKPSDENTTFRQVISWAAQIAGCFARCNSDGYLELRWFATSEFDNISSWLDGGIFDGMSAEILADYMNTDTGMTTLLSNYMDDGWFKVENSIGFEFSNTFSDYIYINSNSNYCFSDSQPSGSTLGQNRDINICYRDGSANSIKYQVIENSDISAIKIRFHGYTYYGSSNMIRAYELEYEIFFVDNGRIYINFIKLPTDTSYLGTSSIIENGVTASITPSEGSCLIAYKENGTWKTGNDSNSYITGDSADGGSFNPWNTGDVYDGGTFTDGANIHFIMSSYSSGISTDNVVITGVKVIKKIKEDGQSDSFIEYTSGTNGYVVVVENNDFIDGSHGQDIANWLGTQLIGLSFRKAEITHPSDPSIEAGDVALYFDTEDNYYPILVSSTTFEAGNSQHTVSSAETPRKNSAQRFTEATRNYVEIRKQLKRQKTEWEEAEEDLIERIENSAGLYCTEVTEGSATKTYYHNKPLLAESDIQMLFSTVGFTLSNDGGQTWYGMTVDGTMIAAILTATGINADWINTGALSVKDSSNREILYANADTGIVRINAYNGATTKTFYFDSTDGTLKMKGELSIGGNNNQDGFIEVFDSSNNRVGRWDGSKIYLGGISGTSLSNPLTELSSSNGLISRRSSAGTNIKAHVYNGIVSGMIDDYAKYELNYNNFVFYGNNSTTRRTVINDNSISLRNTSGTTVVEMYVATPGNGCLTLNNLTVTDIKSKVVDTNYGNKLAYCYEMPSPMYGDIGSSTIGDDGVVFVDIDPVFADYIYENGEYYVFLQNEGEGKSYVSQKTKKYFVISGTPGLKVAWEIKAKQADSHWMRSEDYIEDIEDGNNINYEEQAFADVMNYLNMEVTT